MLSALNKVVIITIAVLVLRKLKKYPQPHGRRTEPFLNILQNLRTLHIVWSLVRRRISRIHSRILVQLWFGISTVQYWSLLNWQNLRMCCGCVAVPVNWIFDIISLYFAKFKNVIHSLEPGETPSNSASHQSPNYVQRA